MSLACARNAPEPAATLRFSIDGRWYEAPENWVARAMKTRRALGAGPNEAAIDCMLEWARSEDQRAARRSFGLAAVDEDRLLA